MEQETICQFKSCRASTSCQHELNTQHSRRLLTNPSKKKQVLTCCKALALREGGTMSGVSAAGGSFPACFCWISHMANANCSGLSLPSWFMSHRFLKSSVRSLNGTQEHFGLCFRVFQSKPNEDIDLV